MKALLTVDVLHDDYVVRDAEGGIWWPEDEAQAEIKASADPENTALLIVTETPMRGAWRC
jgi:regulator of RNase E activity RraA